MLALAIEIIKYSAEKTRVMTDDEVCDIIRRSDDNPEAFAEIIDSFSPLVHTVISGMFDRYRKADLDDAVSDTFLRLWKSRRTYDKERGSYANYVILNARASAVSMLRKFYREKEFIFEYGVGDLDDVAEDNVEQEVFSSFDSETVRNVISALPDDDRELIVCKYFYMMRVRDIAKRTRRSGKSVEARLYKLRVASESLGISVEMTLVERERKEIFVPEIAGYSFELSISEDGSEFNLIIIDRNIRASAFTFGVECDKIGI